MSNVPVKRQKVGGSALTNLHFLLLYAAMLVAAAGNTALQSVMPAIGRAIGIEMHGVRSISWFYNGLNIAELLGLAAVLVVGFLSVRAGTVEIGAATAAEIAATGIDWNFSPTVAVAQDDRWGRTYESYSEDPAIAAELGAAVRRAWQLAETGRAVVLEVGVALDDVPPGFEDLAGDFPERRQAGEGADG